MSQVPVAVPAEVSFLSLVLFSGSFSFCFFSAQSIFHCEAPVDVSGPILPYSTVRELQVTCYF